MPERFHHLGPKHTSCNILWHELFDAEAFIPSVLDKCPRQLRHWLIGYRYWIFKKHMRALCARNNNNELRSNNKYITDIVRWNDMKSSPPLWLLQCLATDWKRVATDLHFGKNVWEDLHEENKSLTLMQLLRKSGTQLHVNKTFFHCCHVYFN